MEYFNQIRKLAHERGTKTISLEDVRNRLRLLDGFDEALLQRAIEMYEGLNVWAKVGESLMLI